MSPLELGILPAAKINREEFSDKKLANQVESLAEFSHQFVPRHKITISEDDKHCINGELHPYSEKNLNIIATKICRRAKLNSYF